MGFQGSVESFSLADVFQNLAMNQQTGTLRVTVPDGPVRHIFFDAGQVKKLSRGTGQPLLLGEMFVGRGLLNEAQVAEALAQQKETHQPLGGILVERQILSQEQIDEVVSHQIEEEIYEMFAWERAQFEFTDGAPPEGLFAGQLSGQGPSLPISHLIMEAARRVDEWERLRQQVPNFKDILAVDESVREVVGSGQLEVDAIEKRVLELLDGRRDVEDVIQDSFLFRFEVLQALAGFLQSSMVRPATAAELAQTAERFTGDEEPARRVKVLERLLAVGGDRPEIRSKLADALVEAGQNDKAAIHLSLLADAQLQAGHEENGIDLYRRILQIVPSHLPSRHRLGALYARRGQTREALIQYQEVLTHCLENKQYAEARQACTRALEVDPESVELRRELIQIYLYEENKRSAARECETLGDRLTRQGLNREAADCYRRAMQITPGLSHLKKKLANVMLTQEDRRARNKRTAVLGAAAVALLVALAVLALRELNLWKLWTLAQADTETLIGEAAEAEQRLAFGEASQKYGEAIQLLYQDGLPGKFSPFSGAGPLAAKMVQKLEKLRNDADNQQKQKVKRLRAQSRINFAEAQQEWKTRHIFAALKLLKKILDNPHALPEVRHDAGVLKDKVARMAADFSAGQARLRQPPSKAFPGVAEEYEFKMDFLRRFKRVSKLNAKAIKLPLKVLPNVNQVNVFLDGKLVGSAHKNSANIFRYSADQIHRFEFEKAGYKTVRRSTRALGPLLPVHMPRQPALEEYLGEPLSGGACYDGRWLWVGTENGGLIQLDPGQGRLSKQWAFAFPGRSGLQKEVYGAVVPYAVDGKNKLLLYTTLAGDCLAVKPGSSKPVQWVRSTIRGALRARPAIVRLPLVGDKMYFLVPTGRRLQAYEVKTGAPLWPRGSEVLPAEISARPLVLEDSPYIVVGCENGNLYGLDVRDRDGRVGRRWKGRGQAIRGAPIAYGKQVVAGTNDGTLYFFQKNGGSTIDQVRLQGSIEAPPALQREHLLVGTITPKGFYGVNLNLRTARGIATNDKIDGGVTTAAALQGDHLYFGTENGHFYGLRKINRRYEEVWDYRAPGRHRVVGAPVVVRQRVFFVSSAGTVYAFDE